MNGTMISIKALADIRTITVTLLIFREHHERFCAVKISVRSRDMGSAVAEAQHKVNKIVKLLSSYYLKSARDFENQQRATSRLELVILISIIIILFVLFGNVRDASLILCNVPFVAVVGYLGLIDNAF